MQYCDSDGGGDGIQSDDDEDDEDADKAAENGGVVSVVGQTDNEPEVKKQIRRELANLGSALAFSSDVQVERRLQGRINAVVNELDTRRSVLAKQPDVQTPRLYSIGAPAATLFTDKNGKPFPPPCDRQPARHIQMIAVTRMTTNTITAMKLGYCALRRRL